MPDTPRLTNTGGTIRHRAATVGIRLKRMFETRVPSTITHKQFGVIIPTGDYLTDRLRQTIEMGNYERWEGKLVGRLLAGGERILELGGGIGFISTLAVRTAKPELYHLVEANARLIPVIHETHRLNSITGVDVQNCIYTNNEAILAKGTARFAVSAHFTASSTRKSGKGRTMVQVPARSFNDAAREHRYDTLICDIEGGELDLFAKADLQHFRTLVIELHKNVIGLKGIHTIFSKLSKAGFAYDQDLSHGPVVTFRRFD